MRSFKRHDWEHQGRGGGTSIQLRVRLLRGVTPRWNWKKTGPCPQKNQRTQRKENAGSLWKEWSFSKMNMEKSQKTLILEEYLWGKNIRGREKKSFFRIMNLTLTGAKNEKRLGRLATHLECSGFNEKNRSVRRQKNTIDIQIRRVKRSSRQKITVSKKNMDGRRQKRRKVHQKGNEPRGRSRLERSSLLSVW